MAWSDSSAGDGIATAFLATDYAKLIIGETVYVDGGYHMQAPQVGYGTTIFAVSS
ncbi:hypothetical protein HGP14_31340 [Rhizobium sp. P32RR-XVIII]|uniref:hypothetical protein n=1 Tax=Rhizobium sp. P32RR-XVIII TaxID=2726738 RepID=UPI001456AC09|nr:hypothetical protein [Rhizobium sp. P32RR-XVIII]NLS07741.1 hypothetical protein [Rhizobium sp. P32RR-XVIII]